MKKNLFFLIMGIVIMSAIMSGCSVTERGLTVDEIIGESEAEQVFSDNYLGTWYGFGADNVVNTSMELTAVDEKTVTVKYYDGSTNEFVFVRPDCAEGPEETDESGRTVKSVFIFGQDKQGDFFEFHKINVADGAQLTESVNFHKNAVIIYVGQTVEELTANGQSLEKGFFKSRYDLLGTESVPGETQMEMNQGSAELYKRYDNLLNDIYNCLKYTIPENEFAELQKDEINWIREKENAVKEEEKQYFYYDDNGEILGRGTMAPLAMNSVNIYYTQKRCEYLISLVK